MLKLLNYYGKRRNHPTNANKTNLKMTTKTPKSKKKKHLLQLSIIQTHGTPNSKKHYNLESVLQTIQVSKTSCYIVRAPAIQYL
jgi:hypothetical protein